MQVGAERGKAESRGLGNVITRVGLQGHKGMSFGVHGWAPNVLTPTPQTPRHQSLLSLPRLQCPELGEPDILLTRKEKCPRVFGAQRR